MRFHEQLASLRRARGISQEALAEQLGVSRQAVSKWETGTSQPELGNILALCRILEVSPNQLLGEEGAAYSDAPEIPAPETQPAASKNRSARLVRIGLIYVLCILLLIILGLSLKNSADRGRAPKIESCYVNETRALDNAREFTLKITYSFLPEDQPNKILLLLQPHVQDIYEHEQEVIIEGTVGYVTFVLPYGAECTVQHQSKAKSTLHLQDILKITHCTKDDYQQELLVN